MKYYEDVIEKWKEEIENIKQDILDFKSDLEELYRPFPLLAKALGNALNSQI